MNCKCCLGRFRIVTLHTEYGVLGMHLHLHGTLHDDIWDACLKKLYLVYIVYAVYSDTYTRISN